MKSQIPKAMMALLAHTLAPYHRRSLYKEAALLHWRPRFWPHPASNLLGDLGQATSLLWDFNASPFNVGAELIGHWDPILLCVSLILCHKCLEKWWKFIVPRPTIPDWALPTTLHLLYLSLWRSQNLGGWEKVWREAAVNKNDPNSSHQVSRYPGWKDYSHALPHTVGGPTLLEGFHFPSFLYL